MKNINQVNLKKQIKEKHDFLVKRISPLGDKMEADYELSLVKSEAKVRLILDIMKELKIVDGYKPLEFYSKEMEDSSYRAFTVYKKGYHHHIQIAITPKVVILQEGGIMIELGILASSRSIKREIDSPDYNWDEFAIELLQYIHDIIYRRKDSLEVCLFGV